MSTRKLNALERTLHHAALVKPDKARLHGCSLAETLNRQLNEFALCIQVLTAQELEGLAPDPNARLAVVNFLLGTGLLIVLQGEKGKIASYRAVTHEELKLKACRMKKLSSSTGFALQEMKASIWTKHIKAKTQLHQTVVDRCLKSLTQKQLVKTVTDVRYPTRKIYMMVTLQPALELAGGPWYTDKELDTEFIKLLSDVCLKLVQERSFPKTKQGDGSRRRRLYPLSHATYVTSQQILAFLQKSRVTETVLTVEHVEMLLNVLVLDGKVEKIPAFHMSTWNPDDVSEDDSDEGLSSRQTSKRKRSQASASDDESDSDRLKRARSSKRHAQKRRRDVSDDEEGHYSASSGSKRPKLNEDSSSGSDSDEDAVGPRTPVSHRLRSDVADPQGAQSFGGVVYRAIQEERILSLGTNQSPCVRCPTFDFCASGGPVNPQECVYHDPWLSTATVEAS
ncbi:hypothetical protein ONZ51_g5092 [Trametes cubensis]|uniref:DNA-directed RNA polymerase III subunit RPC6 n=1 Tax=Trametes cubensis TaxID=1111947 RepID=A0AAD7TX43_9APHY|nr:hypothetical protein ONZ51_g5092 [Trametes cubensis]